MAKETIQSIREAELEAKELVKNAETQKASILEQAKTDGSAIKKDILDETAKRAKAAVDEVETTREKVLEVGISHRQDLIDQQNIRIHVDGNRKCQFHVHTGRVGTDGIVDIILQLGETHDLLHPLIDLFSGQSENSCVEIDILITA